MLSKLDHILNNMELFELLTLIEADRRLAALHLLRTLRSKVYHTLWYMLVFYLISSCKGMKISFSSLYLFFVFFHWNSAKVWRCLWYLFKFFLPPSLMTLTRSSKNEKAFIYMHVHIYIHLYCYNVEEMLLFHKYSCFLW